MVTPQPWGLRRVCCEDCDPLHLEVLILLGNEKYRMYYTSLFTNDTPIYHWKIVVKYPATVFLWSWRLGQRVDGATEHRWRPIARTVATGSGMTHERRVQRVGVSTIGNRNDDTEGRGEIRGHRPFWMREGRGSWFGPFRTTPLIIQKMDIEKNIFFWSKNHRFFDTQKRFRQKNIFLLARNTGFGKKYDMMSDGESGQARSAPWGTAIVWTAYSRARQAYRSMARIREWENGFDRIGRSMDGIGDEMLPDWVGNSGHQKKKNGEKISQLRAFLLRGECHPFHLSSFFSQAWWQMDEGKCFNVIKKGHYGIQLKIPDLQILISYF